MRVIFRRTLGAALVAAAWHPGLAHAQQPVTVSGSVQSDVGTPLSGVSVSLRGMAIGGMTGDDGRYQFSVPAARATGQSAILEARRLGFRPDTVAVTLTPGSTITQNFTLSTNPLQLGEVVITGAGTSTTAERIGTVRTSVDSSLITRSNETNVVNALAAKAPGVQVTSQAGTPGASSSIRIRGMNTIQGTGQPLFVVDGTPIDNTTFATGPNTGSTDTPNRASDINPDDIESIEILKSAAAAAIYGARAGQGVVLITTKRGRAGQNRYSLRSNFRVDDVNRTIPMQRSFGQGSSSDAPAVCGGPDCSLTGSSWGPRLAAGTRTWDWGKDAYENGTLFDNTLSVSGGNERTTFFFSGANSNQQGITIGDNDYYNRTSARLKATHSLSDQFILEGNVSYVDARGQFMQKGSNTSGVNLGLWRSPPEFNNFEYLDPNTGLHRSYRYPQPSNASSSTSRGYDNPFFDINEQRNTQQVGRSFGNVTATYTPASWIDFRYQFGLDYVSDERLETLPLTSSAFPSGQLIRGNIVNYQIDNNLVTNLTRSWRPGWDSRLTLGGNLNSRDNQLTLVTGSNLIAAQPFNLNNTTDYSTTDTRTLIRGESYFAQMQQAFADQLFVTATIRNDGFSTFGASERRHWFPSASAAWTFSNVFNPGNFLTTGRLRAAYGVTGTEPGVYITNGFFSNAVLGGGFSETFLSSQGGQGGLVTATRRPQPNLGPEKLYEFEGGIDFGFLRDRVDASVTYYNRRNTDVIFDLPLAFSTGYSIQAANGGEIQNRGIEAQVTFRPIQTRNVDWDIGLQFSNNKSKVTELRGTDAVDLPTGGFFVGALVSAVEGFPMGVFRGYDFARCRYGAASNQVDVDFNGTLEDVNALCQSAGAPNGAMYIGADGFPVEDSELRVIGNPNPKWLGSIRTGLRLGRFQLSGLLDIRKGGDVWNGTKGALYNFGTHMDTENRAECVFDADDNMVCTGNERIFGQNFIPGGAKGRKIDVFGPGAGTAVPIGMNWYQGTGSGFGIVSSQFMEDGGYVKLREISLGYSFDQSWVKRLGLSNVDVRLAGRNLALWTDYTGIDPETSLGGAEVAAQGVDYFNNPQTRSYVITFSLIR